MAIDGNDYVLIDDQTGILLGADTTMIVPEVLGAVGYDIMYDEDAAIEYGEAQGHELEAPGAEGISVDQLADEPRGYIAIDTESGYVCGAEDLRLVPAPDEDLEPDEALALAKTGEIPVVSKDVLDAEGLPFESVNA